MEEACRQKNCQGQTVSHEENGARLKRVYPRLSDSERLELYLARACGPACEAREKV
jgi:hypothetical protein